MKYKRFVLDVPEDFHNMAKRQAKQLNMTLRIYLLNIIYPEVRKREKIKKGLK